jgi:hypothetical protein
MIFVLSIFVFWSQDQSAAYDYKDFENNDLASLEQTSTSLFFSACRYDDGKLILIVPIGSKQGHIVELGLTGKGLPRNPPVGNDGKIEFVPTPQVTDLLTGAQGAFALQQEGLDFLLRQKFTYLAPKSFDRLRTIIPSLRCPAGFWQ